MKKVKIIARIKTISGDRYMDDDGLKAIDNYFEEKLEVPDDIHLTKVAEKFIEKHNLSTRWDIEVEEIKDE